MRGTDLPAREVADELCRMLKTSCRVVVTAPPGAGKSTLLPLTVLENSGVGRILMLEPRRIAARAVASRMAWMLDQKPGQTVGYRMRLENCIGPQTRLEVITEGILTRMLVEDPTLDGVDVVIFDEFHERSLQSDLALALTLEAQRTVRDDLKVVIMSATIDAEAVCKALDAPLIQCSGRCHPVRTVVCPEEADACNAAEVVAHTIRAAHTEHCGDILAFLPGEADIRRCAELLGTSLGPTAVCPLYGMLSMQEQQRAIAPSPEGGRKVVLATPIAETSITIEGVRIVVDSGLCRVPVFDHGSSLSRLETVRISRDMSLQRRGRAGRVAPGVYYRLWSNATDSRLQENRAPEILSADLSGSVLDILAWGGKPDSLPWLTPPPGSSVFEAFKLLEMLGAVGEDGTLTPLGRRIQALPCHPRIARMLIAAGTAELRSLAADLAAVLDDKDPLASDPAAGTDLCLRIDELRRSRHRQGGRWSRLDRISAQYRSLTGAAVQEGPASPYEVGSLIACAWPERVAKARPEGCGHYILACGDPAFMEHSDPLSSCTWLAVAAVGSRPGSEGRIFLAAPFDPADVPGLIRERDIVMWDRGEGRIKARHERRIGTLLLDSQPINGRVREDIVRVICEAAVKDGESMLDWSDAVHNLQRRVATVASWHPELELPDLGTSTLLQRAPEWLEPYVGNATTSSELHRIDLEKALWGILSYEQQQDVERYAPSSLTVPTGSRIRLEYRQGADAPVLRVRLQECFGLTDTPTVDCGRRKVLMELLSPGFKPVQLTSDLRSFWQNTYFEVRSELRRRYPKHSWPDDPLEAEAVRGTGRRKA